MTPTEQDKELLKQCKACGVFKDTILFGNDRSRADGLWVYCKDCDRARHRVRNRKRWENEEYRSSFYRMIKNSGNQFKKTQRSKLRRAVLENKIFKPSSCESCSKETKLIDGHHFDYARAFDVAWLCKRCHANIHRYTVGEYLIKAQQEEV